MIIFHEFLPKQFQQLLQEISLSEISPRYSLDNLQNIPTNCSMDSFRKSWKFSEIFLAVPSENLSVIPSGIPSICLSIWEFHRKLFLRILQKVSRGFFFFQKFIQGFLLQRDFFRNFFRDSFKFSFPFLDYSPNFLTPLEIYSRIPSGTPPERHLGRFPEICLEISLRNLLWNFPKDSTRKSSMEFLSISPQYSLGKSPKDSFGNFNWRFL